MIIIKNLVVDPEEADNSGKSRVTVRCRVFSGNDFAAIQGVWLDLTHTALYKGMEMGEVPESILKPSAEGDYVGTLEIPRLLNAGNYRLPVLAEDDKGSAGRSQGRLLIRHQRAENLPPVGSEGFVEEFQRLAGARFLDGNEIRVLESGPEALDFRMKLIEEAETQINLETYTLDRLVAEGRFLDLLVKKAESGVDVNLILNADTQYPTSPLGALRLKVNQFFGDLNREMEAFFREQSEKSRIWKAIAPKSHKGGVHLLLFSKNPLSQKELPWSQEKRTMDHWLERMNAGREKGEPDKDVSDTWLASFTGPGGLPPLPLLDYAVHEKILTVDGKTAVVGGRNLEDRYFTHWEDLEIVVRGPVAGAIQKGFLKSFKEIAETEKVQAEPLRLFDEDPVPGGVRAAFVQSRPWNRDYRALMAVAHAIESAEKRFYASSQFLVLPESLLKDVILDAARRGVDVRIITNSMETGREVQYSTGYFLTLNYLPELLEAGVRVFEILPRGDLQGPQPYYHRKEFVFDDTVTAIGSFNLSMRSCYMESENLVFVLDEAFTRQRGEAFVQFQEERTREITRDILDEKLAKYKSRVDVARLLDLFF